MTCHDIKEIKKQKQYNNSFVTRMIVIIGAVMFASVNTVSAVIDFSGLTDLINATMTILSTFVNNSSTLYGFFVLMAGLSLIGIVVFGFIGALLKKMGAKMNSGRDK